MSSPVRASPGTLAIALLVAVALHALLLFGLSFSGSARMTAGGSRVDVTLASSPAERRPEDARVAAQQNQLGSVRELDRASQPRGARSLPATPRPSAPPVSPRGAEQGVGDRAVLDSRRAQDAVADRSAAGRTSEAPRLPRELWAPRLQLDGLERSRSRDAAGAGPSRVRRLDDVATYASSDAEYLHLLRSRLEQVGNVHYPRAAERYGINGSLELLMVVQADGSLESVRLLRSSGHAVLDVAAERIVRLAAPYAPFPESLRATADKLEIVRTWHFGEKRLSSE